MSRFRCIDIYISSALLSMFENDVLTLIDERFIYDNEHFDEFLVKNKLFYIQGGHKVAHQD